MQVQDNAVVGIHYTLKNDDGDTLDSTAGGEPLEYIHGSGGIIRGLERALAGKEVGETMDVVLEPEDGYGLHRAELVQDVPRSAFARVGDLEVGMMFQAQTDSGPVPIRIAAVNDDTVTVDGNHALAGERLHFNVTVDHVREATQEEIDHGHVH